MRGKHFPDPRQGRRRNDGAPRETGIRAGAASGGGARPGAGVAIGDSKLTTNGLALNQSQPVRLSLTTQEEWRDRESSAYARTSKGLLAEWDVVRRHPSRPNELQPTYRSTRLLALASSVPRC